MNAETRVCRATKRSFVAEVSQICQVFKRPDPMSKVLRLRGGAGEPRLSISQVIAGTNRPQQNDPDVSANVELADSDSVNFQFVIDLDVEGNLNLFTDNPLMIGLNEELIAEIITKQTDEGILTEIQFKKPDEIEASSSAELSSIPGVFTR